MKQVVRITVLGLAALACMGSASTYSRPSKHDVATLRSRSSFDLGCPQAELQLQKIDERTAGVSGCGRRATYVLMCDYNNYTSRDDETTGCTWLVNASAEPAAAAAPAAPPTPAAPPAPPAPAAPAVPAPGTL